MKCLFRAVQSCHNVLNLMQGDNGRVVYRVIDDETGSGSDVISVNSSSGDVTAARKFDRESADTFSMRLLAEDRGRPSRTAYTTVNIHIEDTDDRQPSFSQLTSVVYSTLYCDITR